MMDLSDLIKPEAVIGSLKANSKKQAIQAIAEKAAELTGLPEREIFETLLQREKLGSTGVGGGIAIPHGKLASLDRIFGLFARLPEADRFRGARRPAGRPGLPAARAGRRRRRSPQGARPHRAAPPRARRRRKTPRLGRQVGALRGDDRRRHAQRGVRAARTRGQTRRACHLRKPDHPPLFARPERRIEHPLHADAVGEVRRRRPVVEDRVDEERARRRPA